MARDNSHLYAYLKSKFAGEESVQVILEQRAGKERRQRKDLHLPERRRGAGGRRVVRVNENDLHSYGFVVIHRH